MFSHRALNVLLVAVAVAAALVCLAVLAGLQLEIPDAIRAAAGPPKRSPLHAIPLVLGGSLLLFGAGGRKPSK